MTAEHLPECSAPLCDWGEPFAECMGYEDCHHLCCCAALRACEQRVIAEREADGPWFRSVVHDCCFDRQTAYVAGLDAAREAVAALPMMKIAGNFPLYDADEALAAIDALRAEQAEPTV